MWNEQGGEIGQSGEISMGEISVGEISVGEISVDEIDRVVK